MKYHDTCGLGTHSGHGGMPSVRTVADGSSITRRDNVPETVDNVRLGSAIRGGKLASHSVTRMGFTGLRPRVGKTGGQKIL